MTLDRFGENNDDTPVRRHDPRCLGGWLGTDLDGRPIPCLQCRPHLTQTANVNDCGKANR
jgi:hypothetical protein